MIIDIMEPQKLIIGNDNRVSNAIRSLISRSKWVGLGIMVCAFPANMYISDYWGDVIMAFGLGVALSLGILDTIVSVCYYE